MPHYLRICIQVFRWSSEFLICICRCCRMSWTFASHHAILHLTLTWWLQPSFSSFCFLGFSIFLVFLLFFDFFLFALRLLLLCQRLRVEIFTPAQMGRRDICQDHRESSCQFFNSASCRDLQQLAHSDAEQYARRALATYALCAAVRVNWALWQLLARACSSYNSRTFTSSNCTYTRLGCRVRVRVIFLDHLPTWHVGMCPPCGYLPTLRFGISAPGHLPTYAN